MATVAERLSQIDEQARRAVEAVEADKGASVVLAAVAKEMHRKSQKALGSIKGADEHRVREAVIEVEQAADSAKAAAEADSGAREATRQAVLAAHLSVCILKGKL